MCLSSGDQVVGVIELNSKDWSTLDKEIAASKVEYPVRLVELGFMMISFSVICADVRVRQLVIGNLYEYLMQSTYVTVRCVGGLASWQLVVCDQRIVALHRARSVLGWVTVCGRIQILHDKGSTYLGNSDSTL